jgi:hypothetical protein
MYAEEHNNLIIDLFDKSPIDYFFGRVPMVYDELNICDILFVGANPSFVDIGKSYNLIKSHCRNNDSTSFLYELELAEYERLFYEFENLKGNIYKLGNIHKVFKDNYPYFKKFNYISELLNVKIEHLDLFPVRETDQKIVKDLVLNNEAFANDCYNIFLSTLKKISPKVIIIENSFIRDMLVNAPHSEIKEFFPSFHFDSFKSSLIGTPINKHGMAVYYTSMLTGQRAIDLGSYHRLIWSLNRFLNP